MTLIYCYDAYCGWCYGFSPVIRKIFSKYKSQLNFEVLSGGMILPDPPRHVSAMAEVVKSHYKRVEELTGVKFGEDYLWHFFHAEDSDWYPSSEKPAIALCVFKDYYPEKQVDFAADLQYAHLYECRDLCYDETYRHLLERYQIPAEEFYQKLHSEEYKEKAYYEFSLCKQLRVTGFPAVFMQVSDSKFYLLSNGFTPYDQMKERIEAVLAETKNIPS